MRKLIFAGGVAAVSLVALLLATAWITLASGNHVTPAGPAYTAEQQAACEKAGNRVAFFRHQSDGSWRSVVAYDNRSRAEPTKRNVVTNPVGLNLEPEGKGVAWSLTDDRLVGCRVAGYYTNGGIGSPLSIRTHSGHFEPPRPGFGNELEGLELLYYDPVLAPGQGIAAFG